MPEKNVLAPAPAKMSGDGSPWYQERGKRSIRGGQPGEFFIPVEKQPKGMEHLAHATGLEAIASALGIKPWQLSRLRNPKYPEYDPEIARIIVKRDKKWTASYQDLFCAIVRRARYKRAMQSQKRRAQERSASKGS